MLSQLRQAASSAAAETPGEPTSFGHWSAAYVRGVYAEEDGEYYALGLSRPGGVRQLDVRLDRTEEQKHIYKLLLRGLESNPELRVGGASARKLCKIFEKASFDSDDVSWFWEDAVSF
jgi:hypothetical protein